MALVKPLHSGDNDVMHFSRSIRYSDRHAAEQLYPRPSQTQPRFSTQRACIAAWGEAVVVQAEVPNSSWNGSLHRVFAGSAGGLGFDSRLRSLGCSMLRMLVALVKPLQLPIVAPL